MRLGSPAQSGESDSPQTLVEKKKKMVDCFSPFKRHRFARPDQHSRVCDESACLQAGGAALTRGVLRKRLGMTGRIKGVTKPPEVILMMEMGHEEEEEDVDIYG